MHILNEVINSLTSKLRFFVSLDTKLGDALNEFCAYQTNIRNVSKVMKTKDRYL